MENLCRCDIVTVDVIRSLQRSHVGIVLATGDNNANKFGANVYKDGKPLDLTGYGVVGYFIRPDMSTLVIQGKTEGNTAFVELPAACYTAGGNFSLAIKISGNDITQTVRIVDGCIRMTQTDNLVDPGGVIPSLDDLFAQIAAMETATAAANAKLAELAGVNATYVVVDAQGDPLAVNDAAALPVQTLVSEIKATQAGEGAASPTNIRPIGGWDTITVTNDTTGQALTAALPETVYGGTFDWTTGVLTVTHAIRTLNSKTNLYKYADSEGGAVFQISGLGYKTNSKDGICTHYEKASNYKTLNTAFFGYSLNINAAYSTAAEFKGYLDAQEAAGTPVRVAYLLETPYTIQLTAQQLEMVKGSNSISSDCGKTNIAYIADTKMYIDGKFAALQNAILAQGANI